MSLQPVAGRILLVCTSRFLFVAPFTGSAGWRAALLALAWSEREDDPPRVILFAAALLPRPSA